MSDVKAKDNGGTDIGTSSSSSSTLRRVAIANSETNNDARDTKNTVTRKKKRKHRKTRNQLKLQRLEEEEASNSQAVIHLHTSADEVEPVDEQSKKDSLNSLASGGNNGRHNTLRESLLTVLGKLVIWRGARYRPTPTASSSSSTAPPNSPPPTECIGRSTSFFSSGESNLAVSINRTR